MGYDAVGKVYIPIEDFYAFVQRYLPPGLKDAGYLQMGGGGAYGLSGIRFTEEDMEVEYAVSTKCSPQTWAEPPDFLKKFSKKEE